MPLHFALFENHLTPDPTDFMAVVQNLPSKTQDDVMNLMVSRGSTVTKAEALAVFEEYALAIEQLLKDGNSVNTPLFNLSPSIKGVFHSETENFNPAMHAVKLNISPGVRLRQMAQNVSVARVQGASPQPDPLYLDDLGSGTRNDTLTPGNIAQLKGSRLKFDPTDPVQGIFILAADGSTETRVQTVSNNKPSQLDFLVPALAPGLYRLEVRAILYKTSSLRKGTLPVELTVA
ncbi:MAG: DNA-binding domain-containing protein [Mangrovibacterium sp.]